MISARVRAHVAADLGMAGLHQLTACSCWADDAGWPHSKPIFLGDQPYPETASTPSPEKLLGSRCGGNEARVDLPSSAVCDTTP